MEGLFNVAMRDSTSNRVMMQTATVLEFDSASQYVRVRWSEETLQQGRVVGTCASSLRYHVEQA